MPVKESNSKYIKHQRGKQALEVHLSYVKKNMKTFFFFFVIIVAEAGP